MPFTMNKTSKLSCKCFNSTSELNKELKFYISLSPCSSPPVCSQVVCISSGLYPWYYLHLRDDAFRFQRSSALMVLNKQLLRHSLCVLCLSWVDFFGAVGCFCFSQVRSEIKIQVWALDAVLFLFNARWAFYPSSAPPLPDWLSDSQLLHLLPHWSNSSPCPSASLSIHPHPSIPLSGWDLCQDVWPPRCLWLSLKQLWYNDIFKNLQQTSPFKKLRPAFFKMIHCTNIFIAS